MGWLSVADRFVTELFLLLQAETERQDFHERCVYHRFGAGLCCVAGLSRSGSTIATGLLLGDNKAKLAQFSFLMVMPPILGEALLDGVKMIKGESVAGDIPGFSLLIGFLAAFISGCLACKWMINIVKKGKLIYFAIYCAIAGIVTLVVSQMQG